MSTPVEVVILGGSYTGAKVAHDILKNVPSAKVTIVNPSDVFYFNIAAPRVLAKPSEVALDTVLLPIADAFKQYPAEKFEFLLGSAKSVDVAAKTVQTDTKSLKYDFLVIATGATTESTTQNQSIPMKPTAGNDLKQKMIDAQGLIKEAKSIVIGGAGPVGVETAGEIAQAYPDKALTLISSHATLLPMLKASAGAAALANLKKRGVTIIVSAKVTEAKETSGSWSITLDNGTTLTADVYIPSTGSIPNTSFLPAEYLDADKGILVDSSLQVAGIKDGSVFALGDAIAFPVRTLLKAEPQIPIVTTNLKAALLKSGKTATFAEDKKLICLVPLGSDAGTGQAMGMVMWSFLVTMIKSKTFFIPRAGGYISA